MKNAMQLKALVRNISKEKRVSAQLVLQNYMLERLLERISLSKYSHNLILKGGFLIAAILGLATRATMDMDITVRGKPVDERNVETMFGEIIDVAVDDDVTFEMKGIGKIRKGDEYGGYKVAMTGNYQMMAVPLKLDITTGDKITPSEIEYEYKMMFEDRNIPVLAYSLETVLAEKLEAIMSRGDQTTRLRDYYDVYILQKLQHTNIDAGRLRDAIEATSGNRDTLDTMKSYAKIMKVSRFSDAMKERWEKYQKDFDYAKDIAFTDTCDAVIEVMEEAGF
jgi:predicted nucleotidyltransferase component of viral defense system